MSQKDRQLGNAAVLAIVISLLALVVVGVAYFLMAGRKGERLALPQPSAKLLPTPSLSTDSASQIDSDLNSLDPGSDGDFQTINQDLKQL